MGKFLRCTALIRKHGLILLVLTANVCAAQNEISKENQVKAVFLFNFSQFIEWPSEAFIAPDSPLVIGILGDDPFGTFLDETVKGEFSGNHRLTIERYSGIEQVKGCHILFVNSNRIDQMRQSAGQLQRQKILIVGDSDGFLDKGGMIMFFIDGGRIRLRINNVRAEAAGLKISSKLLRLAEITNS